MIGTAILKSIVALIQKPTNVFTLLAESLPAGSTFFIFYIVFNTCTHSLELLQVWAQLIIHSFVTARKLTPTPRSLQRATTPWCFQYYYYYPQNILAMVITMIYSVISPLILFAAIAYFAFALLIFKYQFAYCYIRKYENSGRFFRHVFQYTTDGLIIFQITMVGILWLKQAIVGGFFVVALIGFTIYFKIVCNDLFKSRTKYLPLDTGLRSFDNDSSLAMNEIQTPPEGSAGSINDESGLRRRHAGSSEDDGKNVLSSTMEAMASSQGSYSHFRPSVQSDRYEKLDHTESFEEEKLESKQDMEGASPSVIPSTVFTSDDLAGPTPSNHGYYTGSSGLGLSLSSMMEDTQDVNKSLSKHASKNSLSLRIHTKDMVDSSLPTEGSTQEIKLFTVGDDPMDGPKESEDNLAVRYSGGFLDEDGFYIENVGVRNSAMVPQPLASHFDHTPSKMKYQDRTSDFETYIHPALLKPLNRKLWLPKNPLYDHWDLDDTCEIDFALNSSASQSKLMFRVQEEEDHMHTPRMNRADMPQSQRRSTVGSALDANAAGVSLPSPSNWAGCLSDSPPSTAAPVPGGAGSQWDKFDEKKGYQDDTAVNSTDMAPLAHFLGSPSKQGEAQDGSQTPTGQTMTHSASLSSIRMFSPSSPRVVQLSPQSPVTGDGLAVPNSTRFKRSASMPPTPMSSGESAAGSGIVSGHTSPLAAPSPFLSVRSPSHQGQHNRNTAGLPTQQQLPGSAGQSPRVSFVQDTSPGNTLGKASTPLTIRSTMFGAPLLHRHTISHGDGNNIHNPQHNSVGGSFGFSPSSSVATSAATGAVASGLTTIGGSHAPMTMSGSTRKTPTRGAGAFFNMLFGDQDDDVLDADEKKSRFGYETGGMWAIRRGSVDHHDDDDEDDDDDDSALAVMPQIGGQGASTSGASGSGAVGSGVSAEAEGPLGLEELQLAQPSHLDLAETNSTGKPLVKDP